MKYEYVNDWGAIYRMTRKKYLQFLRDGLDGNCPSARDYGTRIGTISFTTLDATAAEFKMQLAQETGEE